MEKADSWIVKDVQENNYVENKFVTSPKKKDWATS
jgi:hypothetical protein